jgi:outer membrane protein assembly factor BamE
MRRFLIPLLLLGLAAGCSNIGPHRIDVQQGNALDQENVARLKTGLNRSQVRFLLGTPLVVDPFRDNRWDYVYVYYKAGKLAEQRRITLFFEGDTLARIEGDLPDAATTTQPAAPVSSSGQAEMKAAMAAPQAAAETGSLPPSSAPNAVPVAAPAPQPEPTEPAAPRMASAAKPAVVAESAVATAPPAGRAAEPASQAARKPAAGIVPPLPSPKNAPPYVDPHPPAEPALQLATDVAQIKPDVMPAFPGSNAAAAASDDSVLKSLNDWADAWSRRDDEAYLAAYDAGFVPQGGGSRANWEKRKRRLLNAAKSIELKIDSPAVDRADDGTATVTFNQYYRSASYRDAVVKQVRMVERDGRWLIVEEKVLSILRGARP